jgi:hypothetical protein
MITSSQRVLAIGSIFAAVVCFTLHAAEPEGLNYKLTIDAPVKANFDGEQVNAVHTEIQYTWRRSGQTRTLILNQIDHKFTYNGNSKHEFTMSRKKISIRMSKYVVEMNQDFAKASPETQTILKDTFDVPLVTLKLDEQGRETSRQINAGPGAKDLLDTMLLANCLIFHPPFPSGKTDWQSPAEVAFWGHNAKGPLTYKKLDGSPSTYEISGKISGTLQNPKIGQPDSNVGVKKAQYAATGQQTFDPLKQEWTHGTIRFEVNFEQSTKDKSASSKKELIEMTLETKK